MGLVDYSSSEAEELEDAQPQLQRPAAKRRKHVESMAAESVAKEAHEQEMPPLPSTFHDLYASTVRQSVVDDPSLHQGRKRQNPHIPGHWPSHLYVEWHPTKTQHDELVQLLRDVRAATDVQVKLHQFLTSDLGAPLPLHISLSRPLSLPGADKDAFLGDVSSAIRNSGVGVFSVSPRELSWYKSPDSNRSFLVLRVESSSSGTEAQNPELTALLTRCNAVATKYGHPALYQLEGAGNESAGGAFHVSVGWALDLSDEQRASMGVAASKQNVTKGKGGQNGKEADLTTWQIGVQGVKAKIGNVVSHIPLTGGSDERDKAGRPF